MRKSRGLCTTNMYILNNLFQNRCTYYTGFPPFKIKSDFLKNIKIKCHLAHEGSGLSLASDYLHINLSYLGFSLSSALARCCSFDKLGLWNMEQKDNIWDTFLIHISQDQISQKYLRNISEKNTMLNLEEHFSMPVLENQKVAGGK